MGSCYYHEMVHHWQPVGGWVTIMDYPLSHVNVIKRLRWEYKERLHKGQ